MKFVNLLYLYICTITRLLVLSLHHSLTRWAGEQKTIRIGETGRDAGIDNKLIRGIQSDFALQTMATTATTADVNPTLPEKQATPPVQMFYCGG